MFCNVVKSNRLVVMKTLYKYEYIDILFCLSNDKSVPVTCIII